MDQPFRDVLMRHAVGSHAPPDQLSEALDAACLRLADLLGGCEAAVRQELLALIRPRILALVGRNGLPQAPASSDPTIPNGPTGDESAGNGVPSPEQFPAPQPRKLTPEELEWALRQTDIEGMIAGLREIQETGGLELRDFLHELEEAAGANE